MKRAMVSLFVLLSVVFYAPVSAMARCAHFDFYEHLDDIPVLAHVRIVKSSIPECSGQPNCQYRFSAEVLRYLKGAAAQKNLHFVYPHHDGCPATATFQEGDEFVLAISVIEDEGAASLFGTVCGRFGVAATEIPRLEQELKK